MMLRAVQSAPIALGNYVRPTRRDQRLLLDLLGQDRLPTSGLVIDPTMWSVHEELSHEGRSQGLEVVLDPQAVDLSMAAGFTRKGVSSLPWSADRPHRPTDLRGGGGEAMVDGLLSFADGKPFTAFLSPSHFLGSPDSEWLDVDTRLARRMRDGLNERGLSEHPLYYSLVVHAGLIRNAGFRRRLIERLRDLDLDGLWLKVHPFGTTSSGPVAIRRYIEACRDFHALGVPVVGDRTGTVGLAMAAFGAVGAIEGGVTLGERFDVGALTRPRTGKPYAPPPRIYLREIGAFLTRKQARRFFEHRGMTTAFGCQQEGCCRRGPVDMIADPRPHFLVTRGREIAYLSSMPEPLRAGRYLEEFLRPATDLAVRAARALPELDPHRRRLDGWRETLGAIYRRDVDSAITYSRAPDGSRINRAIGA